jgi:sarcosine oxidase
VVGAGILGLSTARALGEDGFDVVVHEQHRVGTSLGGSPGRSRIYRISYGHAGMVRMARRAVEAWRRLDPSLLLENGLLETGLAAGECAAALEEAGEAFEWLEPHEAEHRFPEARFRSPVLWTREAGSVRADLALRKLAGSVEVLEQSRIADPRELEADVVCVCAGPWLGQLVDLPLRVQIEQVGYFAGAPDDRPSVIDHGDGGHAWYGVVTPGVGYKVAQDAGRDEEFDPDRDDRPVDAAVSARLLDHMALAFPGLTSDPVHSEACLYTMTPDRDFILDKMDGIVVLGGDSGHAFKFGPLLGRLAADLAQGKPLPEECKRFAAARFANA